MDKKGMIESSDRTIETIRGANKTILQTRNLKAIQKIHIFIRMRIGCDKSFGRSWAGN